MSDPVQLLETLQQSEVFAPDFPKRTQRTHAEIPRLTDAQLRALHDPGSKAIRRARNWEDLASLAHELGALQYEEAIPTLAILWRECALVPLRTAAGHALRAIGTADARAALVDMIEDADFLSAGLAVRVVFDAAPLKAYDELISYFDAARVRELGGAAIPREILKTFSPTSFSSDGPHWTEPRAPTWLLEDRRWLDLCVKLRHDDVLGQVARYVLHFVDPKISEPALAAALEQEHTEVVKLRTKAVGDLVTRYRSGEHTEVWRVLRSLDAIGGDLRM
ncbi:MAG: HEAT repeat domain-containing protein, partial [Planctomycetales bacterium]